MWSLLYWENYQALLEKNEGSCIYSATNGLLNTAMGYHIAFKHKYYPMVFKFAALDVVYADPCGSDFDKRVLQRET